MLRILVVREVVLADLLIHGVDEAVVMRLKERARSSGRSLEAELRMILEQAARQGAMTTARALAEEMPRSLESRAHTDGVELLREDRLR
jgi:plasmid stability protein